MRKKIAAAALAALTGFGTAVIIVATPLSASAWPESCSIQAHPVLPNYGRVSYCGAGTGLHRIVLRCNEGTIFNEPDYYVYGDWAGIGNYSAASCSLGLYGFYRSSYIEKIG